MRQIQHYQLDHQHCALFETVAPATLHIDEGLVWVTVEGRDDDYWLAAGSMLSLPANARVWLSTEPRTDSGVARLQMVQDLSQRSGAAGLQRGSALQRLGAHLMYLLVRPRRAVVNGRREWAR